MMQINLDVFFQRICDIWQSARGQAIRSVNSAHVQANWLIGQQIVEAEQAGEKRADYGKQLLKGLSQQLTQKFGRGFSVSALQYLRAFYLAYPHLLATREKQHALPPIFTNAADQKAAPDAPQAIQHAVRVESTVHNTVAGQDIIGRLNSGLSWTHYRTLIKVDRQEARDYYEQEAILQGWSTRELERQIASLSFDRLLKSRKQASAPVIAKGSQLDEVIKDPYVLEFLNLPEHPLFNENDLEAALLSQLQAFLLELGKGFAFVGRQVRISLDGDHFYPDLVFYHIKLKCYVIVELKLGKLTHGDLGQMQLYVNYYDRDVREQGDNPTVGLVLCSEKNDAVVRYVLDEKQQQIFASRYQLYMPTEQQLRQEIQREKELIESLREKQS
ncbi:MAG: putative nuclease of restriction endonuclease-like (RecB) superfamily [Flavobacteriales bacterium]|jgi:predicted nuclease of restriction endonuclease-like (RecB) superfamily